MEGKVVKTKKATPSNLIEIPRIKRGEDVKAKLREFIDNLDESELECAGFSLTIWDFKNEPYGEYYINNDSVMSPYLLPGFVSATIQHITMTNGVDAGDGEEIS